MNREEIKKTDREHVIYSWSVQGKVNPEVIDHADGIYMYTKDGKKITDFISGLICVNVGHNHPHVVKAMKSQLDKLTYISPSFSSEPKAKLCKMISEVTPGNLDYVFLCNGGAEANENAIKSARWFTGRHKIYSAWISYHGATAGAITLTGDPRRWPAEPGIPGVVKYFGPYPYRCPFGSPDNDPEECSKRTINVLKTQIMIDGPKSIAAIFMEPIVGTNGIIIPPKSYMKGIKEICEDNGILLVCDEVMAGWGRTGKWFGIEHFDIQPDIITTAKGLTSGYIQLGAMIWNKKLWDYFYDKPYISGLTYTGHALACAAGIANIEVYKNENLIEKTAQLGEYFTVQLNKLKDKHPSIGDVRNKGLWACIELVSNRKTKAPIAGYNDSIRNISGEITKRLLENGLYTYCKWDEIFLAPPLIITKEQLDESLAIIDKVLEYPDTFAKN